MWRILTGPRFAGPTIVVRGVASRHPCRRQLSSQAPDAPSAKNDAAGAGEFRPAAARLVLPASRRRRRRRLRLRDDVRTGGEEQDTAQQRQRFPADADAADAASPPPPESRHRKNAKLAAVIREGHSSLQAGSSRLQQEASAPMFPPSNQHRFLGASLRTGRSVDDENGGESSGGAAAAAPLSPAINVRSPSRRPGSEEEEDDDDELRDLSVEQIAEGHRLMGVASDVLEAMCRHSSSRSAGGLTLAGEPIVLLHVRVHKNLRSAVLYWTLPLAILWDDEISDGVKLHMVEWLDHQMREESSPQRTALHELTRRVAAALRSYRVPRIYWKPAPPDMMLAFQAYQLHGDDDDYGGDDGNSDDGNSDDDGDSPRPARR